MKLDAGIMALVDYLLQYLGTILKATPYATAPVMVMFIKALNKTDFIRLLIRPL
jgi:hypothetical protein